MANSHLFEHLLDRCRKHARIQIFMRAFTCRLARRDQQEGSEEPIRRTARTSRQSYVNACLVHV